jgi:hypothetical protein
MIGKYLIITKSNLTQALENFVALMLLALILLGGK